MVEIIMHGANYRDGTGQVFTRKEYIKGNNLLPHYIKYSKKNMYGTHYAQLQKFIENPRDPRSFFVWSLEP